MAPIFKPRGRPTLATEKDRTDAADQYAGQVVNALVGDFLDLNDPVVAHVVRSAVRRQRLSPDSGFEVIVDSPFAANWRLKANLDDPTRVRLADCRMFSTTPDAREARVNEALEALN